MIAGSLIITPPFAEPGLVWRELRFLPTDRHEMSTTEDPLGAARVTLPLDLREAVAKRRSEYLAGRLCAALALRAANLPPDVPRNGRAPVWPMGLAGAISHSDNRAIAVISRDYAGLGVDCETIMPSEHAETLQAEIITPAEATLRPAPLSSAVFLTLAFSAKESLYKALSPRLSHIPGFHAAALTGMTPNQIHLAFDGAAYQAQFRLTPQDCLTFLAVRE